MSIDNIENTIPFDADADRPAELDELNFSEDQEGSFQDLIPESGIEEYEFQDDEEQGALVDNNSSDDDLTPENLIHEDGSRSPHEPGGSIAQDQILSVVDEDEIGEGYGLDEAELARVDPLDGKRD